MSDSFAQVTDLFRERFEGEGIALSVIDQTAGRIVRATPGDTLRTLVFLLDAALRAILAGATGAGQVHLTAQVDDAQLIVSCADTGVFRPDNAERAAIQPSSLGPLELLGPIVARYEGQVEAVGDHDGNRFQVRFPLVAVDA